MKLAELNKDQQDFLLSLQPQATAEEHGIPVYLKTSDNLDFISNFKLAPKANKAFEKNEINLLGYHRY